MRSCPRCGYEPVEEYRLEAANDNVGIIYVASARELLQRDRVQSLAKHISMLPMGSREVPNWMATIIYSFHGSILWANGRVFEIGDEDIDLAFNNDGSFRWIRDFRHRSLVPLKQMPQTRLVPRYRLIDLAVRIDIFNQAQTTK